MESFSFGNLLKAFRKRRKISQQQLARDMGKHLNTIGTWERGECLPDTKGTILELARKLHLNDQETRSLLEASLTELSPYWLVPYQRNPFFTGRCSLLQCLHEHLSQSQTYALTGLGGIGKTQLALEYVYQHAHEYHAMFWIAAETQETLSAGFTAIAQLLQLPQHRETDQHKVVTAVVHWLSTHKGWLLIFDNLEDLVLLKPFLPAARQGAVLITTRLHALDGLAHTQEVTPFTSAEAVQFLLSRANPTGLAIPQDEVPADLLAAATSLVEATGALPLALDQAGAYIERAGCSLVEYLRLFHSHQVRLLAERPPAAAHPQSVVQTFLLSFEKLQQTHPAATDLLRLCAFLHPDAIPEELICDGANHWSAALQQAASDPIALDQTIAELLRFSLVKRSANKTLSLHRLVQVVLLDAMSETERNQWLERAIAALNTLFPEVDNATWQSRIQWTRFSVVAWNQCERLLPHVLLCLEHVAPAQEDLALASGADKAAWYLFERGRYMEAEALFQQALHIRERQLGCEDPEVAPTVHYLAILYQERGMYTQAERLFLRTLHIWQQRLGQDHPLVAHLLNDLAQLYRIQGKYAEAEPLFRHALCIYEQQLGHDHPNVAYTLNGLAMVSHEWGKYAEAETLFQRALCIWEQPSGQDHPLAAYPLMGLANLYREQGKYAEAELLFQREMHIWERQLGQDPLPRLAHPLDNLTQLYRTQGKYAEPLFQGILYLREYSLREQGTYAEREPFFQRALRTYEQRMGHDHPLVAFLLMALANLYKEQGMYAEAEPLFQRALHIREQKLGPEHPDLVPLLSNLANLYRVKGKYAEAELLFQRALRIWERQLGSDYPPVASLLNNLAELYRVQKKYTEAEPLFQRALSIRENRLEPHHPRIADTLFAFAALCEAQDNALEASYLYQRALAIREQVFGLQDPKTIDTRERLRAVWVALGRTEEAKQLDVMKHV